MFVRAVAAYAGTAQKYYWKKIDCNTCDFEVDYQTRVTYHKELFSSTFMLYIVYLKKRNHKKNIWMIVWCKEIKCDTCGFDVDFQRSIKWHKDFFSKTCFIWQYLTIQSFVFRYLQKLTTKNYLLRIVWNKEFNAKCVNLMSTN